MKGMDYFNALEANGVELPVRIYLDGMHPNLYRPHAIGFCDLTLEEGEEITPKLFERLGCFDVTIIADKVSEQVRELAKAVISSRPKHLCILAGETFRSWLPDRGWV